MIYFGQGIEALEEMHHVNYMGIYTTRMRGNNMIRCYNN